MGIIVVANAQQQKRRVSHDDVDEFARSDYAAEHLLPTIPPAKKEGRVRKHGTNTVGDPAMQVNVKTGREFPWQGRKGIENAKINKPRTLD